MLPPPWSNLTDEEFEEYLTIRAGMSWKTIQSLVAKGDNDENRDPPVASPIPKEGPA